MISGKPTSLEVPGVEQNQTGKFKNRVRFDVPRPDRLKNIRRDILVYGLGHDDNPLGFIPVGEKPRCWQCGEQGHTVRFCEEFKKAVATRKGYRVFCFNCGEPGRYRYDGHFCPRDYRRF